VDEFFDPTGSRGLPLMSLTDLPLNRNGVLYQNRACRFVWLVVTPAPRGECFYITGLG